MIFSFFSYIVTTTTTIIIATTTQKNMKNKSVYKIKLNGCLYSSAVACVVVYFLLHHGLFEYNLLENIITKMEMVFLEW